MFLFLLIFVYCVELVRSLGEFIIHLDRCATMEDPFQAGPLFKAVLGGILGFITGLGIFVWFGEFHWEYVIIFSMVCSICAILFGDRFWVFMVWLWRWL